MTISFSGINAPTVTVQRASLCYESKLLFDQLDFTLVGGEWTVILGPSGVGKTSLLRLIAGLEDNTCHADTIICSDGLPVTGRVSYLPQQDLLMPWLTILDNVLLGYRLRGQSVDTALRQRALDLLSEVGLPQVWKLKPAQLSGGMRQRAALVRTFLENRPIVLLDEPFSALDAITRLELQQVAAKFLQKRTVLLVTHDPLEALRLGQRIYVMTGLPAQLNLAAHLLDATPRPVNDPQLLKLQAQLLTQLVAAKEQFQC